MGLLVIEGLLTRQIRVARRRSLELLGHGDVLRPWQPDNDEYAIVPSEAQWRVVEPARLAVLDRHFSQAVAGWPELVAAIMGRVAQRARSLAVRLAIAQIPQLPSHLLLMLWHLADRWGKVGRGGVALPLRLSHAMLADLVSAQRPSVSNALRALREKELVRQASDGTWHLRGNPPPELEQLSAFGTEPADASQR
ncbi:MAG: helix-turn-helix domain-containing protein [Solirubrobacteraceae bacterium MAG38_C4-C5]|nr:helix-turn-helix domain-containing protein [Candidatus Siliceabacter maunaloa]